MEPDLIHAAKEGDLRKVTDLLNQGIDVNCIDGTEETPLMKAAGRGQDRIVDFLLERGADPNMRNYRGSTPLLKAASRGRIGIVRRLVLAWPNIDTPTKSGTTPLMAASKYGHTDVVAYLLEHRAEVNSYNQPGTTALMRASSWGHKKIVELLLRYGARVDATDVEGGTALMRASSWGHAEIVEILLEHGSDLNARDSSGNSSLSLSIGRGHEQVVNLLLRNGAITEYKDSDGDTPLILASRGGHARIVDLLLEKQASPRPPLTMGMEPPSLCVDLDSDEEVCFDEVTCDDFELVEDDFSILDEEEKRNRFPRESQQSHATGAPFEIRLSRRPERSDSVSTRGARMEPPQRPLARQDDLLPTATIDLSIKNANGDTALIEASRNGHLEVVRILLRAEAEVDEVNPRGQTALLVAAAGGHARIVELLLAAGADRGIADENGDTAVMLAARNGFDQVMERILPKTRRREPALREAPESTSEAPQSGTSVDIGQLQLNSLADFLLEKVGELFLSQILPLYQPHGAKGSVLEVLKETLYETEPANFVHACLGHVGVLKALTELGLEAQATRHGSPQSVLVAQFGVPALPKPVELSPAMVGQKLKEAEDKIRHSTDDGETKGAFIHACVALERLLKMSLWGWARLVFDERRDEMLLEALELDRSKKYKLNLLTFGELAKLFRRLPEVIAGSPEVSSIEAKLGRKHIYAPSNKKTLFGDRLDSIVPIRNKVSHDSGGIGPIAMTTELREQIFTGIKTAGELVSDLVQSNAIPRIGTISEETRDQLHRVRYKIVLDDGTSIKVYSSQQLPLGSHFLYFGTQSNPRPVDPLMLPLDQIKDMP
jgi:ankyrin repeat protein